MGAVEFVRSHLPSRYSRGNVEQINEAGFSPASPFREPYKSNWCYRCEAKSEEECQVMQTLGRTCETHGCGTEAA